MLDIPLSVKMRTGVHDKKWNALQLVPKIRSWGASLVTVGFITVVTAWINESTPAGFLGGRMIYLC